MLHLLTFGGLALESDGAAAAPRLKPPRLALLAVLAAHGERGCTRERLIGMFWPDVDEERARHSLRQALYALRSEGHLDVVQAGSSLSLNRLQISSDPARFRAALDAGDRSGAAGLYRGPFLDGFYLSGAAEFERWVELERARLASQATGALLALAIAADTATEHDTAIGYWHRLTLLEPLSGRMAIGYARALAASGDRPKALAFVREHEAVVRRELEADPDPDIRRLEAELRSGTPHRELRPPVSVGTAPESARALPTPRRRGARPTGAVVGLALIGIVAMLATQRGFSRPPAGKATEPPLEEAATGSEVALGFYREGLRAFYGESWQTAKPFMTAALREDSAFAMAAYYYAVMTGGAAFEERQRALRLALRAPERERLLIQADLLQKDQEPGALFAAEAWVAKYPDEARAHATLGSARLYTGDWAGASAALERAIALDLEAERAGRAGCLVCGDFERLVDLYFWWDSLPAVERTARRVLDAHPEQAGPWVTLSLAAARTGDSVAAFAHLNRYLAAASPRPDHGHELRLRLSLEQYEAVEREAIPLLSSSRQGDAEEARGALLISLRNQGRLNDAAHLLRTGRLRGSPPPVMTVTADYIDEALVALESGDPSRAAGYFDSRRRLQSKNQAAGLQARWLAWNTALTATALAAVGDTIAVRRLADTVQYWGERSLFGRDRKVHHFLRGLLLAGAGDHEAAVAEYRAAVHSYTLGYTRINYELGRSLLALARPREAVAVLLPALRGEIDAANLHITRTELHELLALAYRSAGQPDSATVHDRAVVRAWAHSDPRFAPRLLAAQRRLWSR